MVTMWALESLNEKRDRCLFCFEIDLVNFRLYMTVKGNIAFGLEGGDE